MIYMKSKTKKTKKWVTKNMRNLFHLKSKNPHTACAIYEGVCTCKENYIGETKC